MSEVRVTVNDSTVVGKRRTVSEAYPQAIDVFFRIPYAEAIRFKAAKSIEPKPSFTIDATDSGPIRNSPLEAISDPESPLRLHVFRPARPTASSTSSTDSGPDLLPVVVYVHGGGFNFGNPLERDHASFVSWAGQDDGLVVVAVEYRLGPLGFAADPDLGELNLGLKDQRVAVDWVKKWIGGFGGDAGRLTMMGVSAGAHSVSQRCHGRRGSSRDSTHAGHRSDITSSRLSHWDASDLSLNLALPPLVLSSRQHMLAPAHSSKHLPRQPAASR